jgi:hypothetical protein
MVSPVIVIRPLFASCVFKLLYNRRWLLGGAWMSTAPERVHSSLNCLVVKSHFPVAAASLCSSCRMRSWRSFSLLLPS